MTQSIAPYEKLVNEAVGAKQSVHEEDPVPKASMNALPDAVATGTALVWAEDLRRHQIRRLAWTVFPVC